MALKSDNLYEQYKALLSARNLKKNARTESVRELAQLLGCSHGTAARIIKRLVDEKILQSVPGKGCFFRRSAGKMRIGVASATPTPLFDPLFNEAAEAMLDCLDSLENFEVLIIQHRLLTNPDTAQKVLKDLDGILLHSSFFDPNTIAALRRFTKPIVVINNIGIVEDILCSQTVPDFSTAMEEFCSKVDMGSYKKIVFLQPNHENSIETGRQIAHFFELSDIRVPLKTIELPAKYGSEDAVLWGYNFMETLVPEEEKETLFITLSGYIAKGMQKYSQKSGYLPEILSIDNLEGHEKNSGDPPFFTAVDRSLDRCYVEGVKLLVRQLESKEFCRTVLKVPTKLFFRRSIKNIKSK